MFKAPSIQFVRPYSFARGKEYFYREREIDCERNSPSIVKFVSYDPCPAIVIISDPSGRKVRCPRDDLFELKANSFKKTPPQLSSIVKGETSGLERGEKQF